MDCPAHKISILGGFSIIAGALQPKASSYPAQSLHIPPWFQQHFFSPKSWLCRGSQSSCPLHLKTCTLTTPQLIECLENMVQGLIWLAELLIKQKPKYCEVNVICCNLFWALQPSQSALVGLPSLKWLDFSAKQKNLCFLLVWILDFPDQPCFCTRACLFVGLFNLTKQIPLPSSPHLSNEVYSLGAAPVAVASISWDGQ